MISSIYTVIMYHPYCSEESKRIQQFYLRLNQEISKTHEATNTRFNTKCDKYHAFFMETNIYTYIHLQKQRTVRKNIWGLEETVVAGEEDCALQNIKTDKILFSRHSTYILNFIQCPHIDFSKHFQTFWTGEKILL